MNYEEYKREMAAKRRERLAIARSGSKNMLKFFEQAHGITENTKLIKKPIKTMVSVDSEAKSDNIVNIIAHGERIRTADSTPDPNRAFKESKRKKRFFSNDLDIPDDDDDVL